LRSGGTHERYERRGIDNTTATGSQHQRNSIFAAQIDTTQINGHRQIPDMFFGTHGITVLRMHDAGVIEQNM